MIEDLRLMINPDVISNVTIERCIIVKESGAKSTIKKLTINKVPENALAFTLDHQPGGAENRLFKQLSCYLNVANGDGINQGCDIIILWPEQGRISAVVCDLKSEKLKSVKIERQLENSRLFLEYLFSMARFYYGSDVIVDVRSRVVTSGVRKSGVYRGGSRAHSSFDMKHVQVAGNEARIYFDELIK